MPKLKIDAIKLLCDEMLRKINRAQLEQFSSKDEDHHHFRAEHTVKHFLFKFLLCIYLKIVCTAYSN